MTVFDYDNGQDPQEKKIDNFYSKQCQDNELKIIKNLEPKHLYHSRRYYSNGSSGPIKNAVLGEHLKGHILYNQIMRAGCALFIDGLPVSLGYLGTDLCNEISKELLKNPPVMPSVTGLYL